MCKHKGDDDVPDPLMPATNPEASAVLAPLSADDLRRRNIQNAGGIFDAVRRSMILPSERQDPNARSIDPNRFGGSSRFAFLQHFLGSRVSETRAANSAIKAGQDRTGLGSGTRNVSISPGAGGGFV